MMEGYDHEEERKQPLLHVGYARAHSRLPEHIKVLLFGPANNPKQLPCRGLEETGILELEQLCEALDRNVAILPWQSKSKQKAQSEGRSWQNVGRKKRSFTLKPPETEEYLKLDEIIANNPYNKIGFVKLSLGGEPAPKWLKSRLMTACMSARYELPSNRKLLENMTPLQYLANYTRLYREQNRRYTQIFERFKQKLNDWLEYKRLYPALNFMFRHHLSEENFEILCTVLLIDEETSLDKVTFVGVCTFADRLYWTAYLDYMETDTFTIWGPNRTSLEFVDFENLKTKLEGVNLSKEMRYLLYSLA